MSHKRPWPHMGKHRIRLCSSRTASGDFACQRSSFSDSSSAVPRAKIRLASRPRTTMGLGGDRFCTTHPWWNNNVGIGNQMTTTASACRGTREYGSSSSVA